MRPTYVFVIVRTDAQLVQTDKLDESFSTLACMVGIGFLDKQLLLQNIHHISLMRVTTGQPMQHPCNFMEALWRVPTLLPVTINNESF